MEEAFVAGRPALRLLVTPGRRDALERLVLHATTLRIPVVEVEGGSLTARRRVRRAPGRRPRRGGPPAPAAVADVLARAIERGEPAFVLALDSLEDPQNVGTLLRSAEAAGVHGVVFPTRRQAPLTPAAVKASAGATEHLLLAPVDDLPGHARRPARRGASASSGPTRSAALTYREADLRGPLVLVVGSEGRGLAPGRSAGAATSWSGSRCAAGSSRSTRPWPARCSSSRRPRSAGRPKRRAGAGVGPAAVPSARDRSRRAAGSDGRRPAASTGGRRAEASAATTAAWEGALDRDPPARI